jgi:hypothetical protein
MVLKHTVTLYLFLTVILVSASTLSPKERRAALEGEITTLEQVGFRLHRTTQTPYTSRYVLQVLDEKNATLSLLEGWGAELIDTEARDEVADWLRHGRFGLKIDWDRYLKRKQRSVRVTFRGNAVSQKYPALQRWLDAGNLGAWLSFGEGDRLSRATLIPIDANISEGNTTWQMQVQGYDLEMTRSHPTQRFDRAAHLNGGVFLLREIGLDTPPSTLRIDQVTCRIDMHTRQEGSAACAVPHVTLTQGKTQLKISDVSFDQAMQERNGTRVGTLHGKIQDLDLHYREGDEEANVTLHALRGEVNASMGGTIAYRAHTSLEHFRASSQSVGGKKTYVDGSGIAYGSALKNLYNLIPELEAVTQGRKPFPVEGNVTRSEQWYLEEILAHVIHHGVTAMISPLRIESLRMQGDSIDHTFSQTQLHIKATLTPNTIDVRRSSAPMRMLGALQAKGRWVLSQRDYSFFLTTLPVKIRMMVKIFARHVKDTVVFDLEFDHGHLKVNGQQVL